VFPVLQSVAIFVQPLKRQLFVAVSHATAHVIVLLLFVSLYTFQSGISDTTHVDEIVSHN
jgi:hypothetical protein